MAPSRSKSGSGRSGGRPPRATSRKKEAPATAAIEVVEEGKGLGIDDGIAIVTALLLVVSILLVDYDWGTHYGGGMFFK